MKMLLINSRLVSTLTMFLFFFSISSQLCAQEQESFEEGRTNFIIRKHWYRSQKFADSMIGKKPEKITIQSGLPSPPPLPKFEPFNVKTNTYFSIEPTFFQIYTTVDDFKKDTVLAKNGIDKIVRIHRPDLKRSTFNPYFWEFKEHQEAYPVQLLTNLETFKVNKDINRKIAGYNCYQVLLRYKEVPNKLVELFVTEDIRLNYNPIFNYPEELKKYYPLYTKVYFEGQPNDDYLEYRFLKFYYPE